MSRTATESTQLAAERSVLCASLLDPDALARALKILRPDQFYRVAHAALFQAMADLASHHEPVTVITVADALARKNLLQQVGGAEYLATLMDFAAIPAHVEAHARIIAEAHARREARKAGHALAEAAQNGQSLDSALSDAGRALEAVRTLDKGRPPTFDEQGLTDSEILTRNAPAPPAMVGDRLMVQGGLTILAGHSGLGKTWLMLQLMDCQDTGSPWLGYGAAEMVTGLVEFEMPEGAVLERIRQAKDVSRFRGRRHFWVEPRGFRSISDPRVVDDVSRAIERRAIRHLIFDSLNKIMPGDKNLEEVAELGLNACLAIIHRTGCALTLIHHFNKRELDPKQVDLRDQVLLGLRGSARLQNDPDTILGLMRHHGRPVLVTGKTRYAPAADQDFITIRQDPATGWCSRVDGEPEIADRTREKVEKALLLSGDRGCTVREIMSMAELSQPTVSRYLDLLGAVAIKQGNARRYFYPNSAPLEFPSD